MSTTPVSDKWGDVKAWYKSKTILGGIVMAAMYLLRMFVPSVDADGIATEVVGGADQIAPALDGIWQSIVEVFGLILVIWGRIKAKAGLK